MRCRISLAVVALVLAFLPAAQPAEKLNEAPEGFTALFNGKDLTGWKVYNGKMDVWGAEDGILFVKGEGGGWLMTTKEYEDFEVRLEFKLSKMGNSGVAIRSPLQGDPAYSGMEIQILDDANYEGLRAAQYCGSIYGVVPPKKRVTKPHGEWNRMRIVAKGRQVTITLNETKIVDANLDDYKEHAKEHPGILRTKGHVGLQSHTDRIDFRNIYIKALK
jgi:hypothetical protein